MAVEKLELSQEDLTAMEVAGGYQAPEVVELTPEPEPEPQAVITTNEPEQVVIPEPEETPEPVVEEPQLIIQEPEPEPVVEKQPEAVPTKVKTKVYNNQLVAALNKYVATVENPDPLEFVRQYQANYDHLDPVEVIRQEIVNDPYNKGLRPSAIKKLLDERLANFDLESDDPEDRADALDLLKREAEIVKTRMIKSGKEFVSQFESDLEIEIDAPVAEQAQLPTEDEIRAQREALEAKYIPEVAKFVKNGVIQIKDRDTVINIPAVDAKEYVNSMVDPVEFVKSIAFNPDGTPNLGRWIQLVTAAKNLNGYNSTMIKHGIALGQEKLAGKIKNEAPLGQSRPTIEQGDKIITPNEDINGFVKAAANIRPWQGN